MWNTVQYVTTAVSLVAFVVAAITVAYRGWLKQRAETIKHAPEKDRAKIIAALERSYGLRLPPWPTSRPTKRCKLFSRLFAHVPSTILSLQPRC